MVKRIAPENNPASDEADFERALRALRHADPRIRYRAVAQLGRLGDRRALRHLAAAYRTDPDPRVRAAAARVGQAIHDAAPRQDRPEPAGTARAQKPAAGKGRRARGWMALAGVGVVVVALVAVAGVTLARRNGPGATGEAAITRAAAVDDALAYVARLRAASRPVLDLWEALRQGEEVMCTAPFPAVPEPYALADRGAQFPELVQTAQAVNEGRKMLLAAIDIWAQECANPRYLVPDDVRDAGYAAALTAQARLDEAARLLEALRGDAQAGSPSETG